MANLIVEKIPTIYGSFFSWKGDLITQQLRKYSSHTRNELGMIKDFVSSGDNIIDVGAHIGTFSIPFSRFNSAQGLVFAFEANPNNYKLLEANIAENGLGSVVVPHFSIVSAKNSSFRMHLPRADNSGTYYFLPEKNSVEKCSNCLNLDDWHKKHYNDIPINFIKIDVEGAEVSALLSCKDIIESYKPILYVEINKSKLGLFDKSIEDIDLILREHGYKYFRNIGERNSTNDEYKLAGLSDLKAGGVFYDVLAIHPGNSKYPGHLC